MKCIIRELRNKLKTAFIPMPERDVVAVSIWINVGGRYENKKNLGISHFLEHLAFRGTKKRTAKQIKQAIEGIGGLINAFTSSEYTCFYAKTPKKHIYTAIDVLSDIILNPLMRESDIEREKKIIIEEIKMYEDMPSYHIEDILNEAMWKDHPLARPLTGTYKSVRSLSYNEFKNYKKRFYHSANMAVVVGGSLNIDRVTENIKDKFIDLEFGRCHKLKKFIYREGKPTIKYLNKDTQQSHLCLGFHTTHRTHPDRYPLSILSTILGGNMSSRLFQKVREEHGLAYQISTFLKKFHDTGAFIISAGVKHKKVQKTISLILDELEKIKKEGVNGEELQKAKEYIVGHTLIGLENSADCMLWVGAKIITNDPTLNIKEIIKKIRAVTSNDIKRVANEFLKKNNINLALIGPLKKTIKNIRLLMNDFD